MKLLLLTQVLPYPPNSGPRIKTFHLIRFLSRSCQITLVSFIRKEERPYVDHLRRYCQSIYTVPLNRGLAREIPPLLASLTSRKPFIIARDFRPRMVRLLHRIGSQQSFDVVMADQLNMAPYALQVAAPIRILDTHNALWLLYRRLSEALKDGPKKWLFSREWKHLKDYEGQICRAFDRVLAVSQTDKLALQSAIGRPHPIEVVPIGIDTSRIAPTPVSLNSQSVLHVGTMYWPPNSEGVAWFIQNVWPAIRQERPRATFDVIGAKPPRQIQRSGSSSNGVTVHGYLDDPTSHLLRAAVMVVPLRAAGGVRVKILEALARGLPVVSTRVGCEGLEVTNNYHLLIADTPHEFASAVSAILKDRDLAGYLGRNGRHLVEHQYDYRTTYRPLCRLLQGSCRNMH